MKKLLNTLYVTTPGSYISKDGDNVVVSVEQQEVFRIPIINIEGIVTFGYMGASPGLMKLCADHKVTLSFLTQNGRYIGRFQGPVQGNVLLRKEQYKISDSEKAIHLSSLFISGKIQNYRLILKRYLRDYGENNDIERVCQLLEKSKKRSLNAIDIDLLRGIEGEAASNYFSVCKHLLLNQQDKFIFNGRNRRPPKDEVNALLSFVYTLLSHECISALETVGLDPYVGFLHSIRPGRPSLALDLMEELRAYMGDRLVFSLINRQQIKKNDFIYQGEEGVLMKDSCRKTIITAWQQRKKEVIEHPFLKEKIPIGLLPYVQAMLLARFIRNDIEDYPVFIIR